MFLVSSRAWDKENVLNSHEESNLRPSDSALRCSTTEPQRLYGELLSLYGHAKSLPSKWPTH